MVEGSDWQDLLSRGTWTTQRANSPRPSNPIRANQSYKLVPLDLNDPKVPRTFLTLSQPRFPPPPSVEDEEDSVAKEFNGSVVSSNEEEPKCKGEKDQLPILLPVPEHNPERRFVLVAPSETDGEQCLSGGEEPLATKPKHAANSKAPLDPKTRDLEPAPQTQRRKSRAELPRICTDTELRAQSRPSAHVYRSGSATHVDQTSHRDTSEGDYFSPYPESARPAGNGFLTPVVKHSTKGRDRAYWDYSAGANATAPRDSPLLEKPRSAADRRGHDSHVRPSQRRTQTDMEIPKVNKTHAHHSSPRDEPHTRMRRDSFSASSDRKRSPPPPPPKLSRRESSPGRLRVDTLKLPRNRASYHSHSSPAREAVHEHSSDEGRDRKHQRHHRERRRSAVIHEERDAFLGVDMGLRSSHHSRPKSKPASPLPSPRLSDERLPEHKSRKDHRSSVTYGSRAVSPSSSSDSSSPRHHLRVKAQETSSRTPSIRSNTNSSKPVAPTPLSTTASVPPVAILTDDRTRQSMPPTPTWSRQSSLEAAPCWAAETLPPHIQATPVTPRHSDTNLEQMVPSVMPSGLYSQDAKVGTLPDFPDCPRSRPRAGYTDWYTLPRSESSLNICPSCYDQIFHPTSFRDSFIPAPPRPRDKPIACAMGTSLWHRIAWLMTLKHRLPTLRLLQGIADVSHKNKTPCYGPARVTRTWHSIIDPETRRCISSFKVCTPCAESVQVLFPSLTGVFVPLAAPDHHPPRPSHCSLHYAPERSRFFRYFDILEAAHERAMARATAPDIQRLVEQIDSWAGVEECPRDEPLRHAAWYTMAHVPEMTVCEDCFLSMVYPELAEDVEGMVNGTLSLEEEEGGLGRGSAVARNFHTKPKVVRAATVCQMASPGLRDLFRRACRRHDGVAYLDAKVKERMRSL